MLEKYNTVDEAAAESTEAAAESTEAAAESTEDSK